MRDARPTLQSAALTDRISVVAIYGSLAVIAAIVFGTWSVHPF